MAELLPVPEVAAGATEVVLSEWTTEPGRRIARGEVVAVVETEKAVVEVESDRGGVVLRLLADLGSSVSVGDPLALLGSEEEVGTDLDAILAQLGVVRTSAASKPDDSKPAERSGDARLFVSPIARKLLKDAGVSPDGIEGTGPNGRIRRRDVEQVIRAARESSTPTEQVEADRPRIDAPDEQPAGVSSAEGPWTDIPHSRLRRTVARRLTESKREVPHFYLRRTARVDALLELRAELNEAVPAKISINDFLIRAIGLAHVAVPEANVTWAEDALRSYDGVDVSVAIASERGLVTPVLRGVEQRSLSSISAEVKRYAALAEEGRLRQGDLEGGSITISNLGMYGIQEFDAILNPPQAMILAVGSADSLPAVVEGRVVPATSMSLVASVDHRAVDGALGAQWMAALVDALEHPLRLLA